MTPPGVGDILFFKGAVSVNFFTPSPLTRKTAVLALFLALGFARQAFAVGESGAVELKIPAGVRAIAMGEAFTAVADDANSIYWNPAGLRQLGGMNVTAQYDVYIETVQYGYAAIAASLGSSAAFGIGVKYLTTGTEPAVDAKGVTTGDTVGETYYDIALAAAFKFSYYVDVGITAKYITKTLGSFNASTAAMDIGLRYSTPIPHLAAGFNIQNLGPGLKFDAVTDPLPINVKVGLAYKMFDDNLTLAYDMNFPNDNAASFHFGGEYWYKNVLVGRFGYKYQGAVDYNQVGAGWTSGLYMGAGVNVAALKGLSVGLDYAWTNDGFLGVNHHFALDLYF